MTTAQEASNGHCVLPPPGSFPHSQDQNPSKDSTNKSNSASATGADTFRASAYHFPPKLFTPQADSFRNTIPDGLSAMKLPDRCQFMFSDGRQCGMARCEIHPSLCRYHSEREEQLFGDPFAESRGRSLDLPELFSASRDLTTPRGVTRALGQVFRLLAQRRISRQEAATFAKLGQLLLQSISAVRAEQAAADFTFAASAGVLPNREMPQCEANPQPALSGEAPLAARPEIPSAALPFDSGLAAQRMERTRASSECAARSEAAPRPATLDDGAPFAARLQAGDSSSVADHPQNQHLRQIACNSSEINTCTFPALETVQNQHLQKNGEGAQCP